MSTGGASFIEGDTLKNYPLESGLPRGTVRGLAVGTDGTVWAGTFSRSCAFRRPTLGGRHRRVGIAVTYIEQVLADKTGNLWILARDKVALTASWLSSTSMFYAIPGDNAFHETLPVEYGPCRPLHPVCTCLDPTRDDAPACRPLPAESFALWLVDQNRQSVGQ